MNADHGPGWIGVDLDGTLAHYDGWRGVDHVGDPVPAMLERVKRWLAEGRDVRIFTARAASARSFEEHEVTISTIIAWCERHLGRALPITALKDIGMAELWDDRVVAVEPNTGRALSPSRRGLE